MFLELMLLVELVMIIVVVAGELLVGVFVVVAVD